MELVKLTEQDLDELLKLYDRIICGTPEMDIYGRWKTNLYPTEEDLIPYVCGDEMYALKEDGRYIAAMAVTMYQGESYHGIEWGSDLKDDETAVIHVLGVDPDWQRKGIAGRMMDEAVALAAGNAKSAVRLDSLASNIYVHKVYREKGFEYRGKKNLFACNTGYTDFYFFELLIRDKHTS